MSEDLTRNLPPRPFEERVLAGLAAMRNEFRSEFTAIRVEIKRLDDRLTALEEKDDRRSQETRPIWEDVQVQLGKLDTKFDLVIKDLYEVRHDQMLLARRVDQIERRAQQ
jgi:Skp family chaperone for outer membrane proteins